MGVASGFRTKDYAKLRFCVDHRRFNFSMIEDTYPLQRIDDCIDSLGATSVFYTLDANCGYWKVRIDMGDRNKT